ncbi:TlpA family protein disulfide reductase [Aquibacillus rhizosphaerae]|uniref:TlpA disulfide reductase family protein n=1 Tax=Aquibacillus rhizosphaerae TaxID=3051431 RepID=A0ABT7L429_9BACI|nr:TlpA disulfide reductase family protein [Aquibacillus sp. LR5S19]MDL4839930.1 TlpA disulfide reductase family protein [Aquibacillus sp. LR5S19]
MKAPNFKLPFINKEGTYSLTDDLGKIIIISFWTSWCPECGTDLPKKEQLYHSIDKNKVKMLTINVAGRERNQMDPIDYTSKFLSQTTLIDKGRDTYDKFDCKGVPTTIIINSTGEIHSHFDDKSDFLQIVKSLGQLIV